MFSASCLLASLAILFYVLKFRVHVHVTYTPTSSRRKGEARSGGPTACSQVTRAARRSQETTPILDITSGLVNLGASKAKAHAAAVKAYKENPGATFDVQFSVALQEVWRAA